MQRLKATHRIAILLSCISTIPIFLLGLDRVDSESLAEITRQRIEVCEQLAVGCSLHLGRQDYQSAKKQLDQFAGDSSIHCSVQLKRFDGLLIHQKGDHARHWKLAEGEASTMENIRVPLQRDGYAWGTLEVAFEAKGFQAHGWVNSLRLFAIAMLLNGISFALFLRRALAVLDQGNIVPKRVRNTLDTIVGGVVVLDAKKRILLANEAFSKSCESKPERLIGHLLDEYGGRMEDGSRFPWDEAMSDRRRVSGKHVFMRGKDGSDKCFVVNATPLFDAKECLAGALVSFEDITALEQQRTSLVRTLEDLEFSKEKIRRQNEKLQSLAFRDSLTGAFNRRALFEKLEESWLRATQSGVPLVCMMLDVDHFKRLNDNYGHAAGDQVLIDVVRTIEETVGERGLTGRYGGEEFCVVLPETPIHEGMEIAESIRRNLAVKLAEPYAVTISGGVSSSIHGAASVQAVLEQADKALYSAKHGGRNAIRLWHKILEEDELKDKHAVRKSVTRFIENQSISYHAVASLHAALAYRDAETAVHSQRVAEMSVAVGRGLMTVSQLYILELAALLHDIGKIGVPDSILLKPGRLTEEEWRIMETHASIGVEIVEASFDSPELIEIVRWHHCRYDGAKATPGMPVGEDIPLGARIVCIVDAYDAMVSDRVYRKGRPPEEAFQELRRCAGTQFDAVLVERFAQMQLGWRPDSRHCASELGDKLAIAIGHQTERIIHCYEERDVVSLQELLRQLSITASNRELPMIHRLANQLADLISSDDNDLWDVTLPIVQDLIEMCLTVQRAHLREVGARPKNLEYCAQQAFLNTLSSV